MLHLFWSLLDHFETLYIKRLRMLRLILASTKELSFKNYVRAWNPYFDMNLETHQYSGILIKKSVASWFAFFTF